MTSEFLLVNISKPSSTIYKFLSPVTTGCLLLSKSLLLKEKSFRVSQTPTSNKSLQSAVTSRKLPIANSKSLCISPPSHCFILSDVVNAVQLYMSNTNIRKYLIFHWASMIEVIILLLASCQNKRKFVFLKFLFLFFQFLKQTY